MTRPAGDGGVQREEGGRLECLECGRWYRLLPPHLARAHGTTAAAYRAAHRLPRTLPLRARDLAARAREQGRARIAARPDIRGNLAAGREALAASGYTVNSDTADYPMVREAHRSGGRGKRAAAAARVDAAARTLGYADLAAYLADRGAVPTAALARELSLPRTTVAAWRARLAPGPRI